MQRTEPDAAESSSPIVKFVALHAALVAAPVLVVALLLRLWFLALPLALVAGAAVTAWRLRGIDARIADTLGARSVTTADAPRLAGLARSVAMTVGVPVPRLHVIDSESANAVSWGAGDGPVCLAVTTALLDATDVVELEAVVGHHLAGADRRAVDARTLAAVLFGPLARGPLTGLVVGIVQGEEDRSVVRADLDGVRATRYPPGLVGALERVRDRPTHLDGVPPALAGMCFAAPHAAGGAFDVHPSIDDRIDLLREI